MHTLLDKTFVKNTAQTTLTIQSLVSPKAGQNWKLELVELIGMISSHYHKIQRQFILVTEGLLTVLCHQQEPLFLSEGEIAQIEPGIMHALVAEDKVQFLALDLPGFDFPEDVYEDLTAEHITWAGLPTQALLPLEEQYFGHKIQQKDYAVYELISGQRTEGKWSAALLEIQNSPKHFHVIEYEHFVVVKGTLDIQMDGRHHILATGEAIKVRPKVIHQLRSATNEPVHVLCFNFPAFDPADMYLVAEHIGGK